MNKFDFPTQIQRYKIFQGHQELERVYFHDSDHCIARLQEPDLKFLITGGRQRDLTMRLQCSRCRRGLFWKRENKNSDFTLYKWKISHRHRLFHSKEEAIKAYLLSLPPGARLKDHKATAMQRYDCSYSHFCSILKKLGNPESSRKNHISLNLQKLKQSLLVSNYFLFCTDEPNYPQMMMLINPMMRRLYHRFGYTIKVDIIENLIKEIAHCESRQGAAIDREFSVGFLTGINQNAKLLIYGVFVFLNQDSRTLKLMLEHFFSHVGSPCETIVTSSAPYQVQAVLELQEEGVYDGAHAIDLHEIGRVKGEAWENVNQAVGKSSSRQCDEMLLKLQKQWWEVPEIRSFLVNSSRICYSKLPATFIGLPLLNTKSKLTELVKERIPQPLLYSQALQKILDIAENSNSKGNLKYHYGEQIENYLPVNNQRKQDIGVCRKNLCASAFRILLINLFKTTKLTIKESNANEFVVAHNETETKVNKTANERMIQCCCHYSIKTHIPCEHEIKCSNNLWKLIGSFWKIIDAPQEINT